MVEIPPEAAIAIAGWITGVALVFIGWRKIPVWVKNRQALALKDKKDPIRVNLVDAIKEDVLPDFKDAVRHEVSDMKDLRIRVEEKMEGVRLEIATIKQRFNDNTTSIEKAVAGIAVPDVAAEFSAFAKTPEFQEAMQTAMKSAWARRVGKANAEEEGAGAEEAISDAARAAKDPTSAALASRAIEAVENLRLARLLSDKEADKYVDQIRIAWRSGRNLASLAQKFGIQVPMEGGGSPGRPGAGAGPI